MAESVFGKPIDNDVKEIGEQISALNSNTPEIITNTNGVAYKFPNGLMICKKHVVIQNVVCDSTWGSLYESQRLDFGNWPVAFTETPSISAVVVGGMGGWLEYVTDTTMTVVGNGYFVRPNTNTALVEIDFIGFGLWK